MISVALVEHYGARRKRFVVLIPLRTSHWWLGQTVTVNVEAIRTSTVLVRVAITQHVATAIGGRLAIHPRTAPTFGRVLNTGVHESFLIAGVGAVSD
jgi:hypothetical protein